jgi:hypothetical protein
MAQLFDFDLAIVPQRFFPVLSSKPVHLSIATPAIATI